MSSKFEEKQAIEKDLRKEKESFVGEKGGKSEKSEKEHKDQKDNPDSKHSKEAKDNKDSPDSKTQKDHKDASHDHKTYGKDAVKENVKEHLPKEDGREGPILQPFSPVSRVAYGTLPGPEKPLLDTKFVKLEIKEFKEFRFEKFDIKEKPEKEKAEFEGYGGLQFGPGPVEQRLAALEVTLAQLLHFIPKELRPDLSQGALRQEPDAAPADAPAKAGDPKNQAKKP